MTNDQKVINDKTAVPIKLVLVIVTLLLPIVIATLNKVNKMESGIEQAWKINEMQRWVDRLRSRNATIQIPSVEDIRNRNEDRDTVNRGQTLGMQQ